METTAAINLIQQALWVCLKIPGPLLLGLLLVGIVVSVVQALTQIHEATLVFIPKAILTCVAIYALGPWMLTSLVRFTHTVFSAIPLLVR